MPWLRPFNFIFFVLLAFGLLIGCQPSSAPIQDDDSTTATAADGDLNAGGDTPSSWKDFWASLDGQKDPSISGEPSRWRGGTQDDAQSPTPGGLAKTPRPNRGPAQPTPDLPVAQRIRARLTRVDATLDADLRPVWALTEPADISRHTERAWEDNGLRVGMVRPTNRQAFREALAAIAQGGGVHHIVNHGELTPLRLTPALRRTAYVRLYHTFDMMPLTPLPPGQPQFLMRLAPSPQGGAFVEMTPHHHVPKMTVRVRQPEEKMLDGHVFRELTLQTHVSDKDLLVVGLTPLTASASPPDQSPAADTAPSAAASPNPSASIAAPQHIPPGDASPLSPPNASAGKKKPDLPQRLGTLLLAAQRANKPVQIIFVLGF